MVRCLSLPTIIIVVLLPIISKAVVIGIAMLVVVIRALRIVAQPFAAVLPFQVADPDFPRAQKNSHAHHQPAWVPHRYTAKSKIYADLIHRFAQGF